MSGKTSRDKGKRGEREACVALSRIWPGLARSYNQSRSGSDSPDIDVAGCPVWIEVKRAEKLSIRESVAQAREAAKRDGRPVLVIHKTNRSEWLVTMPVGTLESLLNVSKVS